MSRGAARVVVRSRWGRAFRAVGASFLRIGHVLWLEVTGFFFFVFSMVGLAALLQEIHNHAAIGRIAALVIFTVMFAWFAVTSFGRARKRRKQ